MCLHMNVIFRNSCWNNIGSTVFHHPHVEKLDSSFDAKKHQISLQQSWNHSYDKVSTELWLEFHVSCSVEFEYFPFKSVWISYTCVVCSNTVLTLLLKIAWAISVIIDEINQINFEMAFHFRRFCAVANEIQIYYFDVKTNNNSHQHFIMSNDTILLCFFLWFLENGKQIFFFKKQRQSFAFLFAVKTDIRLLLIAKLRRKIDSLKNNGKFRNIRKRKIFSYITVNPFWMGKRARFHTAPNLISGIFKSPKMDIIESYMRESGGYRMKIWIFNFSEFPFI